MNSISGYSSFPTLSSAQNSALNAIAKATGTLDQAAAQIADPTSDDIVSAMVDMSQSLLTAQAGAAILRTSDQMLGSLLDVKV